MGFVGLARPIMRNKSRYSAAHRMRRATPRHLVGVGVNGAFTGGPDFQLL